MWHLEGCKKDLPTCTLLQQDWDIQAFASPGPDRQLRVENAGGDTELLQEELEPVAPVHGSHEQQRLTLNQSQLQQRVDKQELVLLLTLDAVLLQLAAVRQLRALQLEDHLTEQKARPNNLNILQPSKNRTTVHSQWCSSYYIYIGKSAGTLKVVWNQLKWKRSMCKTKTSSVKWQKRGWWNYRIV